MTRYLVLRRYLVEDSDIVLNRAHRVRVILASDLPAHDAALRAQVWDELEKAAQICFEYGEQKALKGSIERAEAAKRCAALIMEYAAALRQRVGRG